MSERREPASIRAAADRDAVVVADLWSEAYVRAGGGRTEPYSEAEFFDTARNGQIFVAERGGELVGVVALSAPGASGRAVARAEEAELSRLAVTAKAQRLGIGRALARHCELQARAASWSAIVLWSRLYQSAAHGLYESLGYRRLPERDTVDETGHPRLVFKLVLA